MPEFIYIKCPNCKVKVKIDKEKKYHDCPDCKYEFRIDQISDQLNSSTNSGQAKKESIFGKFMKEKNL